MKETLSGLIQEALKEQTSPPPEKKPEDYTTEDTCKTGGFHWYEAICHKEPQEPKAEEPAAVVEARKALFEEQGKVKTLEKQLTDAKQERENFAKNAISLLESIIPSDQVTFSHGQTGGFKRLVDDVKRVREEISKS